MSAILIHVRDPLKRRADTRTYAGIIIEAKTRKFSLHFDKIQ